MPVVVMSAVNEMGFEEATAIVAGLSEQVAAVGAPVQEIATLPLKPVPGVSCKLNCAVWPATTTALNEDCGEEFSWNAVAPVPCTATVCGEVGASSVRVMDAERAPVACGVKVTVMEQLALTAMDVFTQLLLAEKSLGFAPPRTMLETCSVAAPIFVT